MSYQTMSSMYHFDVKKLEQNEHIKQPYSKEMGNQLFRSMKPFSWLIIEGGGIPATCPYWLTVVKTEKMLYVYNSEVMVRITADSITQKEDPDESDWKELFLAIGSDKLIINHYEYLELVIDSFWKQVFDKTREEMWCSGIITSHGDKCYGYEHEWKEHGIPFKHGVLIFLLSYTKELGDRPKHETCAWVIEKYQHYLPFIKEAEKLAGL